MSELSTGATLLDLPVELRLQIASYALEQPRDSGLVWKQTPGDDHGVYHGLLPDENYSSASNLGLLLVCRSFYEDFTRLAYGKTTFVLQRDAKGCLDRMPLARSQTIRRLVIPFEQLHAFSTCSFDMKLEDLSIVCPDRSECNLNTMVDFLRCVDSIKHIRLLFQDNEIKHRHLKQCYSLAGAILKEDHYQRYDAPGAPNIEASWWSWKYDAIMHIFTFTAQPPKPIMEEKAYMELVAPLIEELIGHWTY
ncbi:hypothetical protein NX059_000347 [Plenodomus lindquistii]|nr:hypothetical protein NX059_000347 [Plenodomus lindquistii]